MYGDRRPVGRCGNCGGVVSVPRDWAGVGRPVASCESCGAVEDVAARLPVLPMRPRGTEYRGFVYRPSRYTGYPGCFAAKPN